tara:strand:- start:2 stop:469 length:468 start_codon:yes stop_codon:yes gene_type:complete
MSSNKVSRFAEDFHTGDVFELGEKDVSLSEITSFAEKYDPFPFHLSDDEGKKTVFGGLISSGWQTALIWLGMMHETILSYDTVMGSPGHDAITWKNPVRPGDTLRGQMEVIETKISKSRPEIGFVKYKSELTNQNGEQVFFTESTLILRTKLAPQ